MVRYCYIIAEGPQDIEFLVVLLKLKYDNLKRVTQFSTLDDFWKPLIPTKYPPDGDLVKRVPVPVFLQGTELSIALHSAIGITRLVETLQENVALIPISQVFGIGLFLDADDSETPQARFDQLTQKIATLNLGLSLPSAPGQVLSGSPRFGIFIAPDNSNPGTLEDILLTCAQFNYPNLFNLARDYVSNIDQSQLTQKDLQDFNKPAGKNKAIVSSISSILRPGKTLQVSLQDNRWIDKTTIVLNNVRLVQVFLEEVTGLQIE